MPKEFDNPIIEAAVKTGRMSLQPSIKLEQIKDRCSVDEDELIEEYSDFSPFDTKAVAANNRLVALVKTLDKEHVDIKKLRALLF